jgi:hypothetical protein
MSGRGMTVNMKAELALDRFEFCHLLHLTLEDTGNNLEEVYLTDYGIDVTWGGDTYLAAGTLLSIGAVDESSSVTVEQLAISLSGIDTTLIASLIAKSYINQDVEVYVATMRNHAVYETPLLKFKGEQVSYVLSEDDTGATIAGRASNNFIRFDRRSGIHTTVTDHGYHYPGDNFFACKDLTKAYETFEWGKEQQSGEVQYHST